ncbi:Ig-like domain-containing protein [Methanoculleus sp.]|uniref:Ig-like domain-containing protein n=1 Tax=Methanoculleus sp. TaxID=90427 RepID=UPI0025FE57F9|nr:Ig-like domain-containing protein [Methanoculleus sp.]
MISPVTAVEAAPGEHIYRGFDRAQNFPDIDGNRIVWEDDRNGDIDIYLGTVDQFRESLGGYTGERVTSDPASQERPSISGDYIVWQDDRNGDWDIYLHDASTGEEKQLTDDLGKQWLPAVRGGYAAWYDDSSGRTNIVLYDIAAGTVKDTIETDARTTIPFSSVPTEFRPALSERYVAWVNASDDERIWYYDIAAETAVGPVSTITAPQSWPSLSGSLIAWEDYRHGTTNAEIYMTDLDNPAGEERRITNDLGYQVSPAISDRIVVWEDMRDGPRSIYIYDISAGSEEMFAFAPESTNDEQLYPTVSGNTVVWQRGHSPNSNLYMFVYNPSGAPVEPVLTTIEVTPATATLEAGATQAFQATALDQTGSEMDGVTFSWTSSDETVGTISADGVFTAAAEGTADVTATAGDVSGTATVTVSSEEPALTSIEIDPSAATLAINETETFRATVLDQFGAEMTNVTVTWTSSNTTVGEIDTEGVFTALAVGTTTVTATADNVSAEAAVTVAEEVPALESIEIEPSATTLQVNETEEFAATLRDADGNTISGIPVTWASSNETVGTIDGDGIFTALAAGTTDVTATADNVSGTATVTVTETEEDSVATSIRINPPRATLAANDTQRFMVTVFDQNDQPMPADEVTWTSSDETVGTIGADGIFTALAAGTANVTATAGNVSAEATITVNGDESALARIEVLPSAATLNVDGNLLFDFVAFDRSGNVISDVAVTWASSDETIGTIDADGTFTALAAGTANVTATADNVSGTAAITVSDEEPAETTITVTPAAITLNVEDTATFAALDQNGLPVLATWTSSDETVGTIDADGTFSALAAGTTTITASGENATGTVDVTVTDESSGVVISPSEITVNAGDTRQFSVTAYDPEGNVTSGEVIWSSDDPSVGAIEPDGVFTALGEGTTTITATVAGINETGTAIVTIQPAPMALTRIMVNPSSFTIPANNTLVLTAATIDDEGNPIPLDDGTWTSSDETVGTIDESGTFTALEEGTVTLTVSADGASGSASVTIGPSLPVPAEIEIEPATATVAPGETREFTATVFDQHENAMDWVRIDWSSSDQDMGSIDRAGLFAAFAEGSVDVVASAGSMVRMAAVTIATGAVPEPTPTPTDPGNSGGSTGGGGSDGGDSSPTFFAGIHENLRGGETFTFTGIPVSSVSSVAVTAADAIPRMMVTVKETALPSAAESPIGDVYEYFDVNLNWASPRAVSNATVIFTVPADWLEERNMTAEDVRLMRYVNSSWQSLATTVIGEEDENYHFRTIIPGFSTFAITATSANVTPIEETNSTVGGETNSTSGGEMNVTPTVTVTGDATTEMTTMPTTAQAAPLVYASLLAPLAFFLWPRKKN